MTTLNKPILHTFIELGGGVPDVHIYPFSTAQENPGTAIGQPFLASSEASRPAGFSDLESPKSSNAQTETMGNQGAPTKDRNRVPTGECRGGWALAIKWVLIVALFYFGWEVGR